MYRVKRRDQHGFLRCSCTADHSVRCDACDTCCGLSVWLAGNPRHWGGLDWTGLVKPVEEGVELICTLHCPPFHAAALYFVSYDGFHIVSDLPHVLL